MEEATSSPNS